MCSQVLWRLVCGGGWGVPCSLARTLVRVARRICVCVCECFSAIRPRTRRWDCFGGGAQRRLGSKNGTFSIYLYRRCWCWRVMWSVRQWYLEGITGAARRVNSLAPHASSRAQLSPGGGGGDLCTWPARGAPLNELTHSRALHSYQFKLRPGRGAVQMMCSLLNSRGPCHRAKLELESHSINHFLRKMLCFHT